MKNVYIILSKAETYISKMISICTKAEFSHCSLSFDNSFKEFYSFGRKYKEFPFIGCFNEEHTNTGVYSLFDYVLCKVLKIEITDTQYKLMINEVNRMKKEMGKYKYNYMGIFAGIINKTYKRDYYYYCSEYVYHMLKVGQVLKNEFDNIPVNPIDFDKLGFEVVYEGNLHELKKATIS